MSVDSGDMDADKGDCEVMVRRVGGGSTERYPAILTPDGGWAIPEGVTLNAGDVLGFVFTYTTGRDPGDER